MCMHGVAICTGMNCVLLFHIEPHSNRQWQRPQHKQQTFSISAIRSTMSGLSPYFVFLPFFALFRSLSLSPLLPLPLWLHAIFCVASFANSLSLASESMQNVVLDIIFVCLSACVCKLIAFDWPVDASNCVSPRSCICVYLIVPLGNIYHLQPDN